MQYSADTHAELLMTFIPLMKCDLADFAKLFAQQNTCHYDTVCINIVTQKQKNK